MSGNGIVWFCVCVRSQFGSIKRASPGHKLLLCACSVAVALGDNLRSAAEQVQTLPRVAQASFAVVLAKAGGFLYNMMSDWARQVAWMQASMMAQMGEIDITGEQEQEGEIDVTGTLQQRSSAGLTVVAEATLAAECLQAQLANAKDTFARVYMWSMQLEQHPGGDDLELRAARMLQEVNELLRQQAAQEPPPLPAAVVENLKVLQRHSQDVVLLTCMRWLDQRIFQGKGIPPQLLGRLEAAFGVAALQDDALWSRLGNSMHHILGVQGNGRRRRRARGRRMQIEAAEDDSPDEVMEAGDPVASSSAASSSAANSDLLAGTPARITIGELVRLVPAAGSIAIGEPVCLPGVPAHITAGWRLVL